MKNEHSGNSVRIWVLINASVCHRVGNVAKNVSPRPCQG